MNPFDLAKNTRKVADGDRMNGKKKLILWKVLINVVCESVITKLC